MHYEINPSTNKSETLIEYWKLRGCEAQFPYKTAAFRLTLIFQILSFCLTEQILSFCMTINLNMSMRISNNTNKQAGEQ